MNILHLHHTWLTLRSVLLLLTLLTLLLAAGSITPDTASALAETDASRSFSTGMLLLATDEETPTVTSSVATGELPPVAEADPIITAHNRVYLPLLLHAATTTTIPMSEHEAFVARVVEETNVYRSRAGCPALRLDTQLNSAAQRHSDDMARNNFFSHTGSDGSSPWDRIHDAGYDFTGAAENAAAGQRTPQEVVAAWYNSEGHRANMLNCSYQDIGVGYAYNANARYGHYWTEVFGRR
jgi:uncharacterized protein YkwD